MHIQACANVLIVDSSVCPFRLAWLTTVEALEAFCTAEICCTPHLARMSIWVRRICWINPAVWFLTPLAPLSNFQHHTKLAKTTIQLPNECLCIYLQNLTSSAVLSLLQFRINRCGFFDPKDTWEREFCDNPGTCCKFHCVLQEQHVFVAGGGLL